MAGSYTRRINLYINGKEIKNDISSIKAEMQKLSNEQAHLNRESKEYIETGKKIRILKGIIQEHNQQLQAVNKSWNLENLSAQMNKHFLAISTFIAGLSGMLYAGKQTITMFAEFDDKVADVMKTTGLSKETVYSLNEELKKVNTRTAQLELLDLGRVAGKLNIKQKEDVEGFIRASDKVVVALKEDLGGDAEEAVKQIGKLVSVFKVKDKFGIEDSITKVASAINELGMSSTANEGYIVSFTKRVAGVAPTANISIQDVMGLAATLDHLGQTSEVSSTAYSQVITGMFKDTASYAKAAKMNIKDFSNLLNKDANEAFIRLLKGLHNNDAGLQALINSMGDLDMEGKRAISVIGVLASNVELLRKQQAISNSEFAKGTSLQQEFNVKNNNAQAELEKRRKTLYNIAVDLGQKLLPALTASTSGFSYMVKALAVLTDFFLKHSSAIIVAASSLGAYWIAAKISSLWTARLTQATLGQIIAVKARNLVENAGIAITQLYAAATMLLTGNIKGAAQAMRVFNTVTKASPIGFLVGLLALASGALITYFSKAKQAKDATKTMYDEIARTQREKIEQINQEKLSLNSLVNQIISLNEKSALRKKLIEDLNSQYPGFISNISSEELTNKRLVEQLGLVNKAYVEKAKLAALSSTTEGIQKKMTDNEIRMLEILDERNEKLKEIEDRRKKPNLTFVNQYGQSSNVYQGTKDLETQLKNLDKEYEVLSKENQLRSSQLQSLDQKTAIQREKVFSDTEEWWQSKVNELKTGIVYFEQELEKANSRRGGDMAQYYQSMIIQYQDNLKLYEKNLQEAKNRISKETTPTTGDSLLINNTQEKGKKWTMNNDINFLRESLKLKIAFGKGEIETQKDFDKQIRDLEIKTLTERINLRIEKGQEMLDLQNELANKYFEQRVDVIQREKQLEEVISEKDSDVEKEKRAFTQKLVELRLFGVDKKNMTLNEQNALESLTFSHQERLNKIDAQSIKEQLESRQLKYENSIAQLKLNNAKELEEIKSLGDAKSVLSSMLEVSEIEKVKSLEQAKKIIRIKHAEEEEKFQKEHLEKLLKILERAITTSEFEGLNLSDKLLSDEEKDVLLKRITDVKESLAGLIEPGSDKEKKKKKDNKAVDIFGFSAEDWEGLFQNIENGTDLVNDLSQVVSALKDVWASYYEFINASEKRKLAVFEEGINQEKQALENKHKKGLISQKAYDHQLEKLNNDLDKKKAEIERKAAIRSRNIAIMEAIINTAVAVTSALKVKPPLGLILAATVGVMGGLQVGTILATPLPEIPGKETGGFMYVKREQDGKKFYAKQEPDKRGWVNTPTIIAGESGSEYIIPNDAINNPTIRPVIDILEMARQDDKLATINLPAIMNSNLTYPGKSDGGYISSSTQTAAKSNLSSPTTDPLLINLLRENSLIIQKLNEKLDSPFTAEVALHGRNGLYQKMEEFEKLKKSANL